MRYPLHISPYTPPIVDLPSSQVLFLFFRRVPIAYLATRLHTHTYTHFQRILILIQPELGGLEENPSPLMSRGKSPVRVVGNDVVARGAKNYKYTEGRTLY